MNWEIKRNWGSGSTVNPSMISVGEQGSKSFKNLQYLRIFMQLIFFIALYFAIFGNNKNKVFSFLLFF